MAMAKMHIFKRLNWWYTEDPTGHTEMYPSFKAAVRSL